MSTDSTVQASNAANTNNDKDASTGLLPRQQQEDTKLSSQSQEPGFTAEVVVVEEGRLDAVVSNHRIDKQLDHDPQPSTTPTEKQGDEGQALTSASFPSVLIPLCGQNDALKEEEEEEEEATMSAAMAHESQQLVPLISPSPPTETDEERPSSPIDMYQDNTVTPPNDLVDKDDQSEASLKVSRDNRPKPTKISSYLMASGNIADQEDAASNDTYSDILPFASRSTLMTTISPQSNLVPTSLVTKFKDHFTLEWPTSTIRYRSHAGAARVVETEDFQIILEESSSPDGDPAVVIRRVNESTLGLRALRCLYAIVTVFWMGTLFAFSVQVLFLVFVHLSIEFGLTTSESSPAIGRGLGSLLSIYPFLKGFSHLLALAGAFVVDTFRGHHLMRQVLFSHLKWAVVEWIFFVTFLGLPVFVLCIALLAKSPKYWEITGLLWITCTMIMYLMFVTSTLYHEIMSFLEVIRKQYDECNDLRSATLKAIHLRQMKTYSGATTVTYVAIGVLSASASGEVNRKHAFKDSYEKNVSLFSKFTMWSKLIDWGLYEPVDSKRIYEIEEARDARRYVTSLAWSLERVFCSTSNARSIIVFRGPGAVTRAQMKSTLICTVVGAVLVSLLAASILVYLAAGAAGTMMFLIVFAIVGVPRIRAVHRIWQATSKFVSVRQDMKSNQDSDPPAIRNDQSLRSVNWSQRQIAEELLDQESEGVHVAKEIYRVTQPTEQFSMFLFVMDLLLFLVWPAIALLVSGNVPLALTLIFLSAISKTRYLFDAALALEETGRLDVLGGASEREAWTKQSRLNTIIEKVTRGQSRKVWRYILTVFSIAFLALFAGTVAVDASDVNYDKPFQYLPDWEYPPLSDLAYPSCNLQSFFTDSPLTSLADFAFLSFAPYRSTGVMQEQLDKWFIGMGVKDEVLAVDSFRRMYGIRSQVSFNLVTVPTYDPSTGNVDGQYAYVLVRGSITPWDFLTDAQIWGPSILFEVVRELLPFGEVWTSIIPHLIRSIVQMESRAIDDVSFYKDTRKFVAHIKSQVDEGIYKGLAVIGHSLGGGIAIINGAQEGVKSFALSGPNAKLLRKSLDPTITTSELDTFTFNVIPEFDAIPEIDDRAKNTQEIRCLAENSRIAACHDAQRSLCEIIFSCGTGQRPALCKCANEYEYPPPMLKNGGSSSPKFEEACLVVDD